MPLLLLSLLLLLPLSLSLLVLFFFLAISLAMKSSIVRVEIAAKLGSTVPPFFDLFLGFETFGRENLTPSVLLFVVVLLCSVKYIAIIKASV